MSKNYERRPRVTLPQLECLWKLLSSHKDVVTGHNKSATDREASKRLWKAIALNLNAFNSGATKSWKEWSKYWNNYKCKLKVKIKSTKESQERNEIGPMDWDSITAIEKKFLSIMGKNYKSIIDGGLEAFEPPESSDNSLDSVYDPDTVPNLKVEPQTTNSAPSHTESSVSQNDSEFQQIFIDENSTDSESKDQIFLSQLAPNSRESNKNSNTRDSNKSSVPRSMKTNDTSQRRFSDPQSLRDPVGRPQRRTVPHKPRRRRLYRNEMSLGLDRALRMIVRDSRRKIVIMERMLKEVTDIKEMIKARFPPPQLPLKDS